jgi:serine/threonine protein kinase
VRLVEARGAGEEGIAVGELPARCWAEAGRGDSTVTIGVGSVLPGQVDGHSLAVGERVAGRYRILRFLARGAVGEVYAAHDEELDLEVALKTLRPARAVDRAATARFRREVVLTRALAHPGLCRMFDLGVHDRGDGRRLLFLTMELIEGETLAERLERSGPLRPDEALALVEKLAAALGAAHAAGVIHRDLKPANIMLVTGGPGRGDRVVITDFGLARRMSGTAPGEAPRGGREGGGVTGNAGGGGSGGEWAGPACLGSGDGGELRATATGALVGSPAYMSPEQVLGGEVGPSTDIYAMGVLLFEVLTGRLPFLEGSLVALVSSRLERDAPTLRSVVPDADPRWDAALARCLSRDPQQRFARVEEIPRALRGPAPAAQ